MKAKKPVLRCLSPPPISVVLLDRLFPKKKKKKKKRKKVYLCVDSHQPCEFHENWFKTATCIMTVIIIISWKFRCVIFFKCTSKNIRLCCSKVLILIQKKILWRMNLVLIKFLLNALILEKSWNECKNPSFLHKAMCIESDQYSTRMRHSFLHSWLYIVGGFGRTQDELQYCARTSVCVHTKLCTYLRTKLFVYGLGMVRWFN